MDRRSFCRAASALALVPLAVRAADGFPGKPVRVISPYAAGGGPDVQLRQAGPALGEALGQSIVIENKVGAAGVLAAQYVAQAAPDGYTLLMGSNTHLIQKILQPDLKFDPIADFVPVSNFASSPTVLVVRADSPYQTLEDLIADAKAKPGQMNYGSGGIGTSAHLAGATLASLAGLKVTHIPLKGSVEIAASLLRGDTQFAFPVAGTGVPQVKGGKLRALAVTSRQRLKQLPEVPTLHERLKNELAVQESWFGLWAPARTPQDVVAVLFAAATRTLKTPALQAAFEAAGNEAAISESPQAFAAFVRSENRKWAEIVKLAGVTAS
ncbi:Bug family tripartite tricarboxylate transporter substrate binding protein [Variovorax saccharolyticus]|uniref:Bug family tripartite tricarboxylate transporter substrate binding protein n=1 Tax=Variovorax saccharolyticus TaxID=3053516 RepID=UPI002575A2C1|nr:MULTISPECIES: tripartite tricarboxylate transporter substrate binding protein [unclassified Variovorax]MDM0020013.1 tripartite tricarboxylate transporter substrate binding protein [Variovorax sp. J22R187]MDM0027732.1 tripartite tricarboxylate transporter substrate binding protein [Variovorax sp. J31P216]